MTRDDAKAAVRVLVEEANDDAFDADEILGTLEALPPIVGRKGAAELLGVGTTNLMRQHPDLPEAEQRIGNSPVWRVSTIERYAAAQAAAA